MPANTSVYTGADGSISLSVPKGVEGDAAQKAITGGDLLTIGRVQSVRFEVHSIAKPYHEVGQRYATELRAGNVSIQGTIGRAFLNGAMLNLLLGAAASSRPARSWAQPTFNITIQVQNPALPDIRTNVTLHEVKIDNYAFDMPEDDFVMESVGFQALYLSVEDVAK